MLRSAGGTGRRAVAAVLAWAVAVVPLLVTDRPAAGAPAAATCDADGDGDATGTPGAVFSDGTDAEAARLLVEAGYTVPAARPAYRWRVPVCTEAVAPPGGAGPTQALVVTGAPAEELDPAATAWEAAARAAALDNLTPQLYRPGARSSPPVNGVQVVGIEMWLAVDPAAWAPAEATGRAGEVDVTATATPSTMVWEFSDGVTRACPGPGTQYAPGAPGPAPCGRDFDRTTDVQPVAVAVSIDYTVSWSSSIVNGGTLTRRGEANRYELVVGEVQTYLTDGRRPAPPPPGALPLPPSSRPADDDGCGWSTFWECSPGEIVEAAKDALVEVAGLIVPQEVLDAAEQVWQFLQGCAAFVGEVVGSVRDVFAQFGQLLTDTSGFIRDKLGLAQVLYDAIRLDPATFAREFALDTIDADLLQRSPARWAGQIGCEMAVGILTAGAGATRLRRIFADAGFADRVREWMRRRDGDACRLSSFPTGTGVLLADRSTRPIEDVRPGDLVWAFDPAAGTWGARSVLAQWSYLDTDEMATVRLVDGASVSATDHHRFWSESRGGFAAAEELSPGELLRTPAGPVAVEGVAVQPSGPTLVWELTVAVDHTFAVLAGPHAIAVHNERGECFDPEVRARLEELAADPAHGGQITDNSWQEALVAYDLATSGRLPGLRRDPGPADFLDLSGQAWDVKGYNSAYRNGYSLPKALEQIELSIRIEREYVILDTTKMNDADIAELREAVGKRAEWEGKVIWWPDP